MRASRLRAAWCAPRRGADKGCWPLRVRAEVRRPRVHRASSRSRVAARAMLLVPRYLCRLAPVRVARGTPGSPQRPRPTPCIDLAARDQPPGGRRRARARSRGSRTFAIRGSTCVCWIRRVPCTRASIAPWRRACARARAVVVTTRWHEAAMRDAYPGARVIRIPNGTTARDSVVAALPASGPMRIVHAGMLTQKRSAIPFLEALARFFARGRRRAGTSRSSSWGRVRDENERAVARLSLADRVRFRGAVAHDEASPWSGRRTFYC